MLLALPILAICRLAKAENLCKCFFLIFFPEWRSRIHGRLPNSKLLFVFARLSFPDFDFAEAHNNSSNARVYEREGYTGAHRGTVGKVTYICRIYCLITFLGRVAVYNSGNIVCSCVLTNYRHHNLNLSCLLIAVLAHNFFQFTKMEYPGGIIPIMII